MIRFARLRMSKRSQSQLAILKSRTGLTPNIMGRFSMCFSLKDPSPPNPSEYDEKGSEIHPSVLFGEHEAMFMALMTIRLERDGLDLERYLNPMIRAHFNRGTAALFPRIHGLADVRQIIVQGGSC